MTWQRDVQNGCLIGRMVLRKNPVEAGTPQDSSAILGLKVVGGKRKEAGNLGAFISRVKRGSIADTVGHLRQGKHCLENSWQQKSVKCVCFICHQISCVIENLVVN